MAFEDIKYFFKFTYIYAIFLYISFSRNKLCLVEIEKKISLINYNLSLIIFIGLKNKDF